MAVCLSRAWPVAVLLLAVSAMAVPAADENRLDRTREDLERIQSKIEATSTDIAAKKKAAQNLLAELKRVDQRLARTRARVADLAAEAERLAREIGRQTDAVAEAQERIAALEGEVRQRLIALYKGGEAQLVKVLFSAQSPAAMMEDYDFLQRLVRHDRELLGDFRQAVQKREAELSRLESLKVEQNRTLAGQRAEEEQLQAARSEQRRLLQQVRHDQQALALVLADLQEKAARLSGLLKELESSKGGSYTEKSTSFASYKGRLRWPVDGPLRLGFGPGRDLELGTRYESHGIEIGAKGQQPIAAVWDGQVIFANQFKGFGNLLILDHGDGFYSLYAQASRLVHKVGDQVAKGEVLAYSGFEGNDTVYFEIRQGGTPLDPLDWLAKRR